VNVNAVKGKITPLGNKVFVNNMNFGEQTTAGGIVLMSDDSKDHGIHPRWAQVWAVGKDHAEEFGVGDWILIEHGRWTRGIPYEYEDGTETTIRMVENKSIIMWDTEQPKDAIIGHLTGGEAPPSINPQDFVSI
jgi:co-chaperonin GroES (HSP10)